MTLSTQNYDELPRLMEYASEVRASRLVVSNYIPINREGRPEEVYVEAWHPSLQA